MKSKFKLTYTINVLEQLENHLYKTLLNIYNLKSNYIIFYEPDLYLLQNDLIGKISKLRSYRQNKLQYLLPQIRNINNKFKNYGLKSVKNLRISVNPFNSTSEIIIKNLKI